MRIAMWSGPRNLSTAMMYSFGARADFHVVDEPFYAPFLAQTGADHPMRAEILARHPTDPAKVARSLTGPVPDGKSHFYQKHMTHHMVEGIPRDWMSGVRNLFLIRHPAHVVASYAKKREGPSFDDLGFWQQALLLDEVTALGQTPIVIDSADIRADPERMLKLLCAALDLNWDAAMLRWPIGGHAQDGVWAKHWYGAVHQSTGFSKTDEELPVLEPVYSALVARALPHYQKLAKIKLS
jgi:hypothetical protein